MDDMWRDVPARGFVNALRLFSGGAITVGMRSICIMSPPSLKAAGILRGWYFGHKIGSYDVGACGTRVTMSTGHPGSNPQVVGRLATAL